MEIIHKTSPEGGIFIAEEVFKREHIML